MEDDRCSRWYRENKEKVRARRRERYETDPEYRANALRRSREHYAASRAGARWSKSAPAEPAARRRLMPRRFVVDGVAVVCVSYGALADFARVTQATLLGWLSGGTIPPPTCRDGGGHRWFSREYARTLRRLVAAGRRGLWRTATLREKAWLAMGNKRGVSGGDSGDKALARAVGEKGKDGR